MPEVHWHLFYGGARRPEPPHHSLGLYQKGPSSSRQVLDSVAPWAAQEQRQASLHRNPS